LIAPENLPVNFALGCVAKFNSIGGAIVHRKGTNWTVARPPGHRRADASYRKRFESLQPHGAKAPATGRRAIHQAASTGWPRGDDVGADRQLKDDPTCRPPLATGQGWWRSIRRASEPRQAAEQSADPVQWPTDSSRKENEDLPTGRAQQPQHADVFRALADGGRTWLFIHAKNSADPTSTRRGSRSPRENCCGCFQKGSCSTRFQPARWTAAFL